MNAQPQQKPQDALNFSTLLDTLEDGQLRTDIEKALAEVITAMHKDAEEHGGVPTAAIAIAVQFRLDSGAVEVKADIKTKLPDQKRRRTILWTTPDNRLTKANPRQQQLPFRDVNEKAAFADAPLSEEPNAVAG